MKVAQVMAGNEEGGLEKHFIELCNGLVAHGVDVVAIAHSRYADRFVPEVTIESVDLARGRRNPFALYKLYRALLRHNVDIVHAQASKAMAMVDTLLPWLTLPAVATQHNLKSNNKYQHFAGVIAVSDVAAAALKHRYVTIVHNGIAPSLQPSQATLNRLTNELELPEGPIFLSVARLVPAKGLDILLDAWQQANVAGTLLVVGDGPEEESLIARTNHLNLSQRVRFLGHRDDISALICLADALLISSRYEGGPYTLAEALLLGCPVLSTRVGMVPDYLPAQFMCEPEAPSALAHLLTTHLGEPKGLREKQGGIFVAARQSLTLEAMVQANMSVYRRVLDT
ncbi:glycosyltransferase involved in cell wall biosynthesis [Paraperlucidibaca baekdonensis]|uniref:Glycosyltransferase involved in cell wall biosynthesis n=1 Tax=Paraperlucidibaca baekdonensis TaxID=748120 RepID=A0A3E0H9J1_9GAMM|nr:glycosyltransferase [Paraperlucidibaca baekdonensis]REH40376.1 glycosyltransferase involved in cell wall biosynthesis [Paraperlucidibaca baekdonensis]